MTDHVPGCRTDGNIRDTRCPFCVAAAQAAIAAERAAELAAEATRVRADLRTRAAELAAEATRVRADLRTRFAVAMSAAAESVAPTARRGYATYVYDLADALAREDARRREAEGVK